MRAGILAAGVGRRLGDAALPPKVLLPFDGTTLLARHAATLRHCGIRRCELVVGYRADLIEAEIARIGAQDLFVTRFNEAYEQGSIVSLGALADLLTAGEPMVFMDGDVLCDTRMLERLLAARQENCFLLDRNLEPGEEPVKLCVRDGRLVDCHKRPATRFDWSGEWVGFCRLGPEMAAKIAACAARMIAAGRRDAIEINYLLRNFGGRWRVVDIFLDAKYSEMAMKRSEYSAVVSNHGFDSLIQKLEEKLASYAIES